MPRSISVFRRKPDLVDLWVQKRDGVASYNFKTASNFDDTFIAFETVPSTGLASVGAQNYGFDTSQFRDKTRFRFDPDDYGIDDTKPIWLLYSENYTDGSTGPDEAIHLIYPVLQGRSPVVLNGAAPSGATFVDSLEINLQTQCQNFVISNKDAAETLLIAFAASGPEFEIPPSATPFTFSNVIPTSSQLFVRCGVEATIDFNLICSVRNEAIS